MAQDRPPESSLSKEQYASIAVFRFTLRRFLAFSEAAAAKVGLPPQQHQALLAIAGHPGAAHVGTIAEQLLIAPHSAAELVARMADAALLTKTPSAGDRRRVELALTLKAEALLQSLTAAHLDELRILEPVLMKALGRMDRLRSPAV